MVSSFGGALCVWLKTPLPWMIGPLVAMAVCNFSGARLASPPLGRELGLLMVVCAIPVLLTQADLRGGDLYLPVVVPFAWAGLLPLFGIAATGGLLLSWLRFPNPWMMGPLIATILATASGLEFSSMSSRLSNVGQVLLGCALGARFSRQFLIDAPRFIAVILSCIVLMIVLSAAMGWGLATVAGIFVPSMIWAAAPAASPKCRSPRARCNSASHW